MAEDILTLDRLRKGNKRVLAEALALAEHSADTPHVCALLDEAYENPKAHVVGFTGPPGVGKSTLINALVGLIRSRGDSVGVIAVDPSSHKTGGALLGDRTRMTTDPDDKHVFFRSLASRGKLGGLSELAYPATILMRAVFDWVIVESVGVGQSEADISKVSDTVILGVQPGSGDSLQFMKAGIMEIPDIAVVTKADFGKSAERALGDLQGALSLAVGSTDDWQVPQLAVSANSGVGLEELITAIEDHKSWLVERNKRTSLRLSQASYWLKSIILNQFGLEGLKAAQRNLAKSDSLMTSSGLAGGPFTRALGITQQMRVQIGGNQAI